MPSRPLQSSHSLSPRSLQAPAPASPAFRASVVDSSRHSDPRLCEEEGFSTVPGGAPERVCSLDLVRKHGATFLPSKHHAKSQSVGTISALCQLDDDVSVDRLRRPKWSADSAYSSFLAAECVKPPSLAAVAYPRDNARVRVQT